MKSILYINIIVLFITIIVMKYDIFGIETIIDVFIITLFLINIFYLIKLKKK